MSLNNNSFSQNKNYKWWSFFAIGTGLFVSVADVGSVVVVLPSIAEHFSTDLPTTQWVIIGYALTVSALLLPMGRLSDIVGRKKVYLIGYTIFAIGAGLAGFSSNISILIFARIIMGFGAAMTQGVAMAMHVSAFPKEERGKAVGLILSVVGTGGVAGPAVGGLIVSTLGWQWVFIITAILSVLVITFGKVILDGQLKQNNMENKESFDWLGAGLSSIGLITFMITLSIASKIGWGHPFIGTGFLATAILFSIFIWWEHKVESPMINLGLFKRKIFSFGLSSSFIMFFGMSSVRFLLPFYLQIGLGYTPAQTGLIFVPGSIALALAGTASGALSDKFGWRIFNVSGMIILGSSLLIFSQLTLESHLSLIIFALMLQSVGMGTFNPPNYSSILSVVNERAFGVISGFLNLIRNSANVTGTAIVTAIVTIVMGSKGFQPTLAAITSPDQNGVFSAYMSGMNVALITASSLALLGLILTFAKGSGKLKDPNTNPHIPQNKKA